MSLGETGCVSGGLAGFIGDAFFDSRMLLFTGWAWNFLANSISSLSTTSTGRRWDCARREVAS